MRGLDDREGGASGSSSYHLSLLSEIVRQIYITSWKWFGCSRDSNYCKNKIQEIGMINIVKYRVAANITEY